MTRAFLFALALLAAPSAAFAQDGACPPEGYDRARLATLRGAAWEMPARERRAFATALVPCLASPDPFLRDQVALEALSSQLRAGQLGVLTQTDLVNALLPRLSSDDLSGFERPFAALALSEVVRAERLNAHFTDDMREDVLNASIAYMHDVNDYRGFNETEGWRHGVAHGADLLLQHAANESTSLEDLLRIRGAVGAQVAPEGHFYIYGESERLMRPILFMARRSLIEEDDWTQWLTRLAAPREDAFNSQAGLAWRHNTTAFLSALYLNARLSDDTNDDVLLPGAEAAMRAMP